MTKAARSKAEVHTTPSADGTGWVNQRGGAVVSTHQTKEKAVEKGRAIARREATEHVIHNQDGTVGQKNSYGNDQSRARR